MITMGNRNFARFTLTTCLFAAAIGVYSCKTASKSVDGKLASANAPSLEFSSAFNLADFKGKTYLTFMRETVKPAMDSLADDGYVIRGKDSIEKAYEGSDKKVQAKVDRLWGGVDGLGAIAEKLKGKKLTMDNLPAAVATAGGARDRYGIATFIGLASGGGVAIQYAKDNYSYNIHYARNEKKSGRSYGTGPGRGANDASDKEYLNGLEKYFHDSPDDQKNFQNNLFRGLVNNDTSHYGDVSAEGQSILTDFFAVYTAEEARNLMGKTSTSPITPYWEAALLEVTLLASFHSNQSKFTLFYTDPQSRETTYTNATKKQTPCANPDGTKGASLADYWQFSRNISDATNCKRSGINITKKEFRGLGRAITEYMVKKHRDQFDAVYKSMNSPATNRENMYAALSYFLVNDKTPATLADQTDKIVNAWTAWLETTRSEANLITKYAAEANQNNFFTSAGDLGSEGDVSGGFDAVNDEDAALGAN